MRVGTIVSLVASAALGLGALFVARVWLPSQSGPKTAPHSAPATAPGVPVVLAAGPIAYGDKIDPKRLTLAQLPADLVPPGAFSSVEQVMKQDSGGAPVALVAISAKEPILASKLSGAGGRQTLAAMIGDGYRAYTIGVTEVAGGGGHILPGDRVDVVVTRDAEGAVIEGGKSKYISEVAIQNVRVLGMDLNVDPTTAKPSVAHTATLEVNVEDAERLALAAQAGTLSLALRRAGSAEVVPVRPMQTAGLGAGSHTAAAAVHVMRIRRPVIRHGGASPMMAPSAVLIVHGGTSANVAVPAEALGAGI